MIKRKRLKKKLDLLERDLARINAILVSNDRLFTMTYGEVNISRIMLESESLKRQKLDIENEIYKIRNQINSL